MKSVVDFVDTSEEETSYIALNLDDVAKSKYYTHLEIEHSLLLGVMGNQVIFPENNPATRDAFFCGQAKQAVSVFHSNYQMRMDKMSVVLNYGQTPLIKSRYLQYINNEEHPYGVNTIVAIMSYTGYNVEDAILINKGAIERGLFNTTYFSMYESREESSTVSGGSHSKFANIQKNTVSGLKQGFDYSMLDDSGLVKVNTEITDKTIVIGKINANLDKDGEWIDDSVKTKKGQLGFVDKSFITDSEEGFNIAKVRIREERLPSIGDKMGSRAGQKGTIGLIIPECDMPFTENGLKPDIIINPHALPSRMTIGQMLESLFGKLCGEIGSFGDCTAFQSKGSNISTYGKQLNNVGFHSSGNELMHNAHTGEQLEADIFVGPTYYMRLKHMVKDKINHRARGPKTILTHQSVHGRANDGGLRIGEMERDGILGHGMASFLNDSFLNRGDEYYIAVCNTTGTLAIYNESKNLFLSPQADGPVKFVNNVDGTYNIKNVSKFGRSFSILRVPYSFKLLLQELQAMNVNMRIITNDNIDNLMSMSYSDNINKILKSSTLNEASNVYKNHIHKMRTNRKQNDTNYWIGNQDAIIDNNEPSIEEGNQISSDDISDIQYASDSPAYNNDIQYASDSPAFNNDIQYASDSPAYNNDSFNINILPTTPPGSPPISQTNQKDTSEIVSLDESKNKSDKSDNSFMGFDITNIFGNDETNKKVSILDPEVDINSINDTDDKNDENDISSNVKQIKITNT
jgi:DNA-directed RNA polymerase beta subunit